jgi:hypothetical protein
MKKVLPCLKLRWYLTLIQVKAPSYHIKQIAQMNRIALPRVQIPNYLPA